MSNRSLRAYAGTLDHRYLNDVSGLEVPTLENLTRWIWHQLDSSLTGVDRVEVSRGQSGSVEGCIYSGPTGDERQASISEALNR